MHCSARTNVAACVILICNLTVHAQESHAGTLTIRLYDKAVAAPAIVKAATEQAERIFARAGVRIVWEMASNEASEAHCLDFQASKEQESGDVRTYLAVRLIVGLPETVHPNALGFSLPQARFGAHVTIFYDRVERESAKLGRGEAAILGHAMAHEIGHVLLGSAEHSPAGLMRGRWNDSDVALAVTDGLYFSRIECARLRGAVQRRHDVHTAQANRKVEAEIAEARAAQIRAVFAGQASQEFDGGLARIPGTLSAPTGQTTRVKEDSK